MEQVVMNIHESIGAERAVSGKDARKYGIRDSVALAKVSPRTRATGIIVSDDGREIGDFLSEYYEVHCYSHRDARLAAPRLDAARLQFMIWVWADRDRVLEALAWIRTLSNLPVIVTGPASEPNCMAALEEGAADYIVDSWGRRELLARIRAVLRHHQPSPKKKKSPAEACIYTFGQWRYDVRKRRLTGSQDLNVALTRSEHALLRAFLERSGRILSRETLIRASRIVEDITDRSIDVLVLRLRRKFSAIAPGDCIIFTERGTGYVFAMPVRRHPLHPAGVK